jgi:fluoride exporter
MLRNAFIVGVGGFIGTVSRYLSVHLIHRYILTSFPLGTMAVNLVGCFLIGIFYGITERGGLLSDEWRIFLTIGFCGGFTTFSSFTADSLALARDGELLILLVYTALSVILGFGFTVLGNLLTKLL